jgi:hypothetical protein
MERIQTLEKRTAELPEAVKTRFRDDPDIRQLLESLQALTERIEGAGSVEAQDLVDVERVQDSLVSVWTDKLSLAEVEVKVSRAGPNPCCRFCGAVFQIPEEAGSERAAWSRLRKHVEKLHPKEWAASF